MQISTIVYGIEVDIEFDYTKGRPMTLYARNGDPGSPAEPDEVVINSISIGGQEVQDFLSPGFITECEQKCYEEGSEGGCDEF